MTLFFHGRSLYYYIDESGNVVFTKNYAIKEAEKPEMDEDGKYIPPTEYADGSEISAKGGNAFVEVGNPADRNKPGAVVLSGYITNKDTKEPIAGATVFVSKSGNRHNIKWLWILFINPSTGYSSSSILFYGFEREND